MVIWIAKEVRDEHRKALDWLNEEVNNMDFFGAETFHKTFSPRVKELDRDEEEAA